MYIISKNVNSLTVYNPWPLPFSTFLYQPCQSSIIPFSFLCSYLPSSHPHIIPLPSLLPMHKTLLIPFSSYLIIPNIPLSHSTSPPPLLSAPSRSMPSLPSSHPLYHSLIPSLLNPFTSYFIHPSLPPLVRVSIHTRL
jgi:hypothetical protein